MKDWLKRIFFYFQYLGDPPWDTGITPPELLAFIQQHPPGRALDLGCGTGTNAITLATHGWEVIGVDFVQSAIRTARRKTRKAGADVKFIHQDVTQLDGISGKFDLVLDIGCFHNLSQAQRRVYIHNLETLLAPDGIFLMYSFLRTSEQSGAGVSQEDLDCLDQILLPVKREDGEERGMRPSAWFWYKK